MNVLFVSNEMIGGNLSRLMQDEGCDVRLYINDRSQKNLFKNIVPKVDDWKKSLDWVGKDGLIVFDDVNFGKEQDVLRKKGYNVFGGSKLGDRLENDRSFAHDIFVKYNIPTFELKNFSNINKAVKYIKKNPACWVTKQNDSHYPKILSYVGQFEDGSDVLDFLSSYSASHNVKHRGITIQKRVYGIEMGIGRYFNGKKWVGPIEVNFEHPHLYGHKDAPCVGEMGTLAWYDDDENNKLFNETLAKLEPFLIEANFKGDMSLNCIVNESGPIVLEATSRLGSPIVHLQSEIQESPWSEFMMAIAKGEDYNLKWKKGFGIVTLIATPPFPYASHEVAALLNGVTVHLSDLSEDELKSVHLEDVAADKNNGDDLRYYIEDCSGYIAYVTSVDPDISKARQRVVDIAKKIHIPNMFYRDDIGRDFENSEKELLIKWGYIN